MGRESGTKTKREHTHGSPGYAVVYSKRDGQKRQGGTQTPAEIGVHTTVALLWGAPKRTRLPMSTLLVVDHIPVEVTLIKGAWRGHLQKL